MSATSVYPIVPASDKALWFVIPVILVLLGVLAVMVWISFSMKLTRFEVSVEGLRIRGDLYGRTIPVGDLLPGEARVLRLSEEEAMRPRWRTNGIGLPGYQSGWFRLRNGEKALLFMTDSTRLVRIPVRAGYAVHLSVKDPEVFLREARAIWGGAAATRGERGSG